MYDGARMPSAQENVNGLPSAAEATAGGPPCAGPGGSEALPDPAAEPKPGEEMGPELEDKEPSPEPVLVKRAHREILDHERKRRVELKCMELQEMMEEQGYSEEEIRQKVSTFRQMLMEKEGVITREGAHTRPPVKYMVHEEHGEDQSDPALAEGYHGDEDWQAQYYDKDSYSSPSPRPKKRKKKKSGRRRSRFENSSPSRREKKKKSGKKHKRDRSPSGSRKKRRCRSGSPKNKQKDKNKTRKRSPVESPSRRSQRRGSCCSSRSASLSSTGHSTSKSPGRANYKYKADRPRSCVSPCPCPDGAVPWHNGHDHTRNGKASRPNHDHTAEGERGSELRTINAATPGAQATVTLAQLGGDHKAHTALYRTPGGTAAQTGLAGETLQGDERLFMGLGSSGKQGCHKGYRAQGKSSHSPANSSDSAHSQHNPPTRRGRSSRQKKSKGGHSSGRHRRGARGHAHRRSPSGSPGRQRHASESGRRKSESRGRGGGKGPRQHGSPWSSGGSSSRSASRDRGPSKAKSPHPHSRQNTSRERDSPHHSDAERARRRSRSYSPIRKRRRDSPSFMEARRITSARKRPIPYYRPSPSSSSSTSSPSHSGRSRSRSYDSYSSYSRSASRSRSPSRDHSYDSRSSYDSPGF